MNKSKFVIAIFLLFVGFAIYKTLIQDERRTKGFGLAKGLIVDVVTYRAGGGDMYIKFYFDLSSERVYSNTSIKCSKDNKSILRELLINRKLDVVYEKKDPGNCEMLLVRDGYTKYKLQESNNDSWILDSIANTCKRN